MELKTLNDFLPLNGQGDRIATKENLFTHHNLQEAAKELIKKENLLKLKEQFGVSTGPWLSMIHEHSDPNDWTVIEFAAFVIKNFFNLEEKNE